MRKPVTCLLCILWACAGAHAELSRVSVNGNHFVTADGKTIVFRGLDTSEPDKLDRFGHWNEAYFKAVKSWGANIIRFPVHPAVWRLRGETNYIELLDRGVRLAQNQGLYVIIDWHSIGNLPAGKFFTSPAGLYPATIYDTTERETLNFWRTMARHYKGNNTVAFFELFNEPALGGTMGQCTWSDWKGVLESMIGAIRAEGGTAVPLAAGFNFAYNLKPVAQDPIHAEGIGYVAHPYPMKSPRPWEQNWTREWGYVADKYPVILTEMGFQAADEPGGYVPIIGDESYGEAITSYCAKRGISYTVWCFDTDWPPALIKDWNFTPTRQGRYFKKALGAN